MKTIWILCNFALLVIFNSCDNAETTYDSPFPKKNKELTKIFGNELVIKRGKDSLHLTITSNKNFNLITNNTGDTLFYGSVSKYRGLFYFSEKIKEGYYYIYAVKISDSLIYGLNSSWSQMCSVEKEVRKGNYKKLIAYMSSDTTIIRLHPNKDEMKELYGVIVNNIIPVTIIYSYGSKINNNLELTFDKEDMEIIESAYPNPAQDYINIDLQKSGVFTYQIANLNGLIVGQGKIFDKRNKVDITNFRNGIYIITIINSLNNKKESIKIIKNNKS